MSDTASVTLVSASSANPGTKLALTHLSCICLLLNVCQWYGSHKQDLGRCDHRSRCFGHNHNGLRNLLHSEEVQA